MRLLTRNELLKTSNSDQGDWNYRPILGTIQRLRFQIVCELLGKKKSYNRILEVGYGSGIFMPELAARSRELYGIDVHEKPAEVTDVLRSRGITPKLFSGSAEELPFSDNVFDCVVVVSALEFVPDLDSALNEIKRVLTADGNLVVVTPHSSKVLDFGLWVLTGRKASHDFRFGRERIPVALRRTFTTDVQLEVPRLPLTALYHGFRLCVPEQDARRKVQQGKKGVLTGAA